MKYIDKFYLPSEGNYYNTYEFYPFNVFCDKGLDEIHFDNITMFYGSNGSGKSTLLNVIIKKLNKNQEVIKASRVRTKEIDKPLYVRKQGLGADMDDFVRACRTEILNKIPIGSELISSEDIFNYILQKRVDNQKKEND